MPGKSDGSRNTQVEEVHMTLPVIRTRQADMSRQSSRDCLVHSGSPSAWQDNKRGPPVALLENMAMRADGHGLSQGLTSILNAPSVAGSSSAAGMGVGAWSWPFSAGTELPLSVPPPDTSLLPPVSLSQFQPYLRACSAAHSQFQATYGANQARTAAQEPGRAFSPGDGLVEALRMVPHMLFDEDFSLGRQETWQQVVATQDEEQRLARLEEYSSYVDTVESQILREIAALQAHSTQFFEASTLLQDLRASLQRAQTQVSNTRHMLAGHCKGMQQAAAEAVQRKRQRANIEDVLDQLRIVEEVASAQQTLVLLLPQGDFSAAMDVLDSLSAMLTQNKTAGLKAFHSLEDSLIATSQGIEELLLVEFLRATKIQKRTPQLRELAGQRQEQRRALLAEELSPANSEQIADLADDLTAVVQCLVRNEGLVGAISAMQQGAISGIKEAIRDGVEQALANLAKDTMSQEGVSEQLQTLGPDEFLALLSCVQAIAQDHMRHVRTIQGVVCGMLKQSKSGRLLLPDLDAAFQHVLQSVSEASHNRWIKLLASRSDVANSLDLAALKSLLECSEGFAQCMKDCGSAPVAALRSACQAQSRSYLDWMHRSGLVQLTSAMDKDLWTASDTPIACQLIADGLCARAAISDSRNGVDPAAKDSGMLHINGHSFHTVSSFQSLLQAVDQYLQFQDAIPGLSAEVSHRIVELVKVYNSRMCQLVLGAGAMQAAGLKSITAKHLAVSCQCVSTIMELHPILTAVLQAIQPVARMSLLASELNLLKKDLVIHRTEIHNKLVGIMRERLIASLSQLPPLAQRWTAVASPTPAPSAFAVSLTKQLRTLSQVLSRILAEAEVHLIFGRIAVMFSKNLAEAFSRLDPLGPAWELQCRADLNHLLGTIQDLPLTPDSRVSSTERLRLLLKTRFAPLDSAQPASANGRADSASNGSSSARTSLVARLGTGRMPFFNAGNRDLSIETRQAEDSKQHVRKAPGGADRDVEQAADREQTSQPPMPRDASAIDMEAIAASDTAATADTDGDLQDTYIASHSWQDGLQPAALDPGESNPSAAVSQTMQSAARPMRETAESLLEKMAASTQDRTFGVDSRLQSLGEINDSSFDATEQEADEAESLVPPFRLAADSSAEQSEPDRPEQASLLGLGVPVEPPTDGDNSTEVHEDVESGAMPAESLRSKLETATTPQKSEKMAVLEDMLKSIQAEDWKQS